MEVDILYPEIKDINGRSYCNFLHQQDLNQRSQVYNEERFEDYMDDVEEDEDIKIIQNQDGSFRSDLYIPSVLHPRLIGKQHHHRKQLESETSTQIRFPSRNSPDDVITITGASRKSVTSCVTRLTLNATNLRASTPFTHFLSIQIPLTESFNIFRSQVLRHCGDVISAKHFQKPQRLHVTLCMLRLLDNREIESARAALAQFPATDRVHCDVRGLEVMNDDPSAVDVLYAKISSNQLQQLAEQLVEHLVAFNLAEQSTSRANIKLHVTLLNSKFALDHMTSSSRQSFDVSELLQRFGDFDFGHVTVDRVLLSSRDRFDSNGFYWTAGQLKLN